MAICEKTGRVLWMWSVRLNKIPKFLIGNKKCQFNGILIQIFPAFSFIIRSYQQKYQRDGCCGRIEGNVITHSYGVTGFQLSGYHSAPERKFFHLPSCCENQLQPDNRSWRGNAGQQKDLLLQKIWVMRKEDVWCYTNQAGAVANSQDLTFSDFPLDLPPKLIHSGVNHCLCCL